MVELHLHDELGLFERTDFYYGVLDDKVVGVRADHADDHLVQREVKKTGFGAQVVRKDQAQRGRFDLNQLHIFYLLNCSAQLIHSRQNISFTIKLVAG